MSTETDKKVLLLIENLKHAHDAKTSQEPVDIANAHDKSVQDNVEKNKISSVRGKPKSGKFWKSQKEKFSSIIKTKGIRPDFQKKTALRLELNRTKELSKQLLEQIKEKKVAQKERRRENMKRTEENKRKSEIVQVITNAAKLKRMKKKQLRFIEKRDITKINIK